MKHRSEAHARSLTKSAAALVLAAGLFGVVSASSAPVAVANTRHVVRGTVNIGYMNVMDDAPTMLADDAGLYQKHGVQPQLQMFMSGTDMVKAIVGGQLDAGVLGFTNALTWVSKGADVKIIGGAQMGYHSMLVRNNSGINSISELKGMRVASQKQGSTADIVLNGLVFPSEHFSRSDVSMVYVDPSVAIQSLLAGRVDAAFVFEPYDHIARDTMPVKSIYEIGKFWPFPCMVVIASGKALKEKPKLITEMLDAQKDAIQMLQHNPAKAAKYLAPQFVQGTTLKTTSGATISAVKVIEDSIKSQTFNWAITPSQEKRMQQITNMMLSQGILAKPLNVQTALDLSWQQSLKKR